jgi:hypothetical protein
LKRVYGAGRSVRQAARGCSEVKGGGGRGGEAICPTLGGAAFAAEARGGVCGV